MKVKIKIECESIGEMISHLSALISETKKMAAKAKLHPSDQFPKKLSWDDDNCYGEHTIKIIPE